MSTYSYRLSRKSPSDTWTATAKYPWGKETFDTFETVKAAADKRAAYLCRQKNAHQRAIQRARYQRAGKPVPPELQSMRKPRARHAPPAEARPGLPALEKRRPGRPRKVQPIDPIATAERLRRAAAGAGVDTPGPELGEFDDGPPGPEIGSEDPAPPIPPMPDPTVESPEVIHPGGAADDQAEEFYADVVAMAYVAGVVRMTTSACAALDPPRKANEPSPTACRWTQEGLSQKLRELMGNSTLGPWSKFLLGSAGIVLSMVWGAPEVTTDARSDTAAASGEPAGAASATESGEGRHAPAAPPASDLVVHTNGVHQQSSSAPGRDYKTPAHGKFKS